MKKSRRVFYICLVVASCLFLSSMNLYAADAWWTASIEEVIVATSPSVVYKVKLTHINGLWSIFLNFTNKEMLAVAMTAYSMGTDVLVKFDDVTLNLKQIHMK
jgi:hypothetical protein